MIRRMQTSDLENVADIWLNTNIEAHHFISSQYWKNNLPYVKELLPLAEVYVYENNHTILGFIGLNNNYIEGIFVSCNAQSQGIGKQLLNFAKEKRKLLCLNVYQKNSRAIHFYQREGFHIQCESIDEATNEKEYRMLWEG